MKHECITEYKTCRLPSSINGNPRYELITLDDLIIGKTRTDSCIAYGPVPNNAESGECRIVVHETPTGRRYVESVDKILKAS